MSSYQSWDVSTVVDWVNGLNPVLKKYTDCISAAKLSGSKLDSLDDEGLAKIGVSTKLHRTKILAGVKKLREEASAAASSAAEPAESKSAEPTRRRGRSSAAKAEPAPPAAEEPAPSKKRGRGKKDEERVIPLATEPPVKRSARGRKAAPEPASVAAVPKPAVKAEPAAAPAAKGRGKRKSASEPAPEEDPAPAVKAEPEAAPPSRRRKANTKKEEASAADPVPAPAPAAAPSAPAAEAASSSSAASGPSSASVPFAPAAVEEKKVESIEIAFSFDTTCSMYPCLTQVRNVIKETVTRLLKDIPHIRIALIAHGDYYSAGRSYVIKTLNFTSDVDTLVKWVNDAGPTEGGDLDECYELVLRDAQKLSWSPKADRRALVVIGDCNPHPPEKNPEGINWREEMKKVGDMNIKIYGVQCLNRPASNMFYETISRSTGGIHLALDQFASIPAFVMGICFAQNSQTQLQQYEQEIKSAGGMNRNMQAMFDKLAGRATTAAAVVVGDLKPVEPGRFQVMTVHKKMPIKEYATSNGLTFKVGRGFYEFTKPEDISAKKEVVLMDKATGDMYTGAAARKLIGLDAGKDVKLKPSTLVHYRVFVQSTSYNRSLVPGTGFLYEVDPDV